MQFLYPSLLWGLALVALPALIHLINLLRHRTVRWAAMEFLLKSHKRQRHWLWLKQLLLLLSRMAAMALTALLAAQWVSPARWTFLAGGAATRHIVLIDDSFSMSERAGAGRAFDEATQIAIDLCRRAADLPGEQRASIHRLSRTRVFDAPVAGETENAPPSPIPADLDDEPLDETSLKKLERALGSAKPTDLALAPTVGLKRLAESLAAGSRETVVVYLLSDFRDRDWRESNDAVDAIRELERSGAEVRLVQCGKTTAANLAIVDLQPEGGARAAGVPMFVQLTIRNQGDAPSERAQVKIRLWQCPAPASAGERPKPVIEDMPTLVIDPIAPGASVVRRVQTSFPSAGRHVVEAVLSDDAIEADNRRWCVLDCPAGQRVLLVDGSERQIHAYHLSAAFKPLERSNTGILAETKSPDAVRDMKPADLRPYSAIYLLDLPRYETSFVQALTEYVVEGGGVHFAFGPDTNPDAVNSALWLDGQGLLPAPIAQAKALPIGEESDGPDLLAEDHPVFSFFRGDRNALLTGVVFERYHPLRDDWKPSEEHPVTIGARLRGDHPLLLEKSVGRGRSIAWLSTVGPVWNDWAKNPFFVVVALETRSHLAQRPTPTDSLSTGQPIPVEWNAATHLPESILVSPDAEGRPSVEVQTNAKGPADAMRLTISPEFDQATGDGGVDRAGVYEAWLAGKDGLYDVRRYAANVDADEGRTKRILEADMAAKLTGLRAKLTTAEELRPTISETVGSNRGDLLMIVLAALLAIEQALAFWASGHSWRQGVAT